MDAVGRCVGARNDASVQARGWASAWVELTVTGWPISARTREPPGVQGDTVVGRSRRVGDEQLDNGACTTDCIRMVRSRSQVAKVDPSPRTRKASKSAAGSALTQTRTQRGNGQGVTVVGSGPAGASEVWQARIGRDLAEQLRADAEVLGLDGRTDIVKAALSLLHRQAAEERMAQSVDEFYGGSTPPLPLGVTPADDGS